MTTLSSDQIAARRLGVGSSDIAALCSLHDYLTRRDVFNAKVFGSKKQGSPEMAWGSSVEEAIVKYRTNELGARELSDDEYTERFAGQIVAGRTVRARDCTIALTTTDSIVWVPDFDRPRIIEAKCVGFHQAHHWGDDDASAPTGYRLQAVWHMGVTGIHECDLVATIAGRPPVTWVVEWDADLYGNLVAIAEQFWVDHVLTGIKPDDIDGSDSSDEYLRQRYPVETAPLRPANVREEEYAALYCEARAQEKVGALAKDYTGNVLKESLGDAEGCTLKDGRVVSWKKAKGGARTLRVPEPKAKE